MPENDTQNTYAQVVVPLAIGGDYSYLVPVALENRVAAGVRVEVRFGSKRIYAGMVKKVYRSLPPEYVVKPIMGVLDDEPILGERQLQLWKWMADYYMCTEGEVMISALPTALKLSSETRLLPNPAFNHDFSLLNDEEYMVATALSVQSEIGYKDVQAIVNRKTVIYLIKSLLEKGVLLVREELVQRYKPKTETYVKLALEYEAESRMEACFDEFSRAPKQQALLMAYVQLSKIGGEAEVAKARLLEVSGVSQAIYTAVKAKGVFEETQREVSRLPDVDGPSREAYELSGEQREALQNIKLGLEQRNVLLLHGVTSSGKTEVYIHLMLDMMAQGRQSLFLLPEIALTTQMVGRLRQVFGDQIGIYHSRFSAGERIEIWHKVRKGEYKAVVGPRSAMFLPFADLGLVVVDEEHDRSYKQYDPAPRYNARDAAIYLAHLYGAKTVLGSATPAIDSFYNAATAGKYGLVALTRRYGGVEPPQIELVNVREAAKARQMKSHFSTKLLGEVEAALERGEQAIFFQNRRGYSPYYICGDCGWIPQCYQCDVSLTYHKYLDELKCHYCGYKSKVPQGCEACGSTNLRQQGFGTEKIEDELGTLLPNAKIGRLDLETARTKKGFERIITDFENKKLNILVGTQMVTKGLDFDNVSVVGIVNADQLIHFPDFRAAERAFQLMLQVSGRAGRRKKRGKVIIQTFNDRQLLLWQLLEHNYHAFYQTELQQRHEHRYPPFSRMIELTLKHKNAQRVNEAGFLLARNLKMFIPADSVLGPSVPPVSRVRNYYLRTILLKLSRSAPTLLQYKAYVQDQINLLKSDKNFRSLIVQADVDPY